MSPLWCGMRGIKHQHLNNTKGKDSIMPGTEEHLQTELTDWSNYGEFKKLPMQHFSTHVSKWINLSMYI